MHVGVGVFVVAVLGDLAAVDIGAQAHAIRTHDAQFVRDRIEVDGSSDALVQHRLELGLHGGFAIGRDGHDCTVIDQAIKQTVGRPHVDADKRAGNSGHLDGTDGFFLCSIHHGDGVVTDEGRNLRGIAGNGTHQKCCGCNE